MENKKDLEHFLNSITEEKWKRLNDCYFSCGERIARVDTNHNQLTLTINNRPIYVGPLP